MSISEDHLYGERVKSSFNGETGINVGGECFEAYIWETEKSC